MPVAVSDATSVQEQPVEIAIRDLAYVRAKTMPILTGVPTLLAPATRTCSARFCLGRVCHAVPFALRTKASKSLGKASKGSISTPAKPE